MLAFISPPAPGNNDYTPLKSSPLRPRDPNTMKPVVLPLSSPPTTPSPTGSKAEMDGARARGYKSIPSVLSHHGSREKRRDMFLRKVKRESEDQRWQARGGDDEIMRSICVSERKRWEEHQARISRMWQVSAEDQDMDACMNDALSNNDVPFQDDDLEAFVGQSSSDISSNPAGLVGLESRRRHSGNSMYGSDDDDYDRIFQELILREEERSHASSAPPPPPDDIDRHDGDYDQIFEELILQEEKRSRENASAGSNMGQQDEDMMDFSHG